MKIFNKLKEIKNNIYNEVNFCIDDNIRLNKFQIIHLYIITLLHYNQTKYHVKLRKELKLKI